MKVLAPALVTLALSAPAYACPTTPTSGTLQQIVDDFVHQIQPGHMFGVCALVLDAKGHEGFACAGRPSLFGTFTNNTLFQIGSVTKTFTATLFSRRVRENVIDFGDRIDPQLPSKFRMGALDPITFGQLATHRSGLPHDPGESTTPAHDFEQLDTCLATGCLGGPQYSNWGYQILGYTLAVVDNWGMANFSKDLRYNVLDMLGMTDTMVFEDWLDERPDYFQAHAADGHDGDDLHDTGNTPHPRCPAADPSGCLYSSIHDMRLWLRYWMHLEAPIQPLANARDFMYALHGGAPVGWDGAYSSSCDASPHGNYMRYEKSGSVDDQRAYFAFLRDPNDPTGASPLGIVIMANSTVLGEGFGLGSWGQDLMSRIVLQQNQ